MASTKDIKDLHVCIIGAGMGGLAAALALAKKGFRKIEVYEDAPGLGFVGAGIQLAPNMARILDRLGCWEPIRKEATHIRSTSIRQHSTDKELAHIDLDNIGHNYGFPHMVGHRASLAGGLYEGCKKESAIKFILGTRLEEVKQFVPTPIFKVKPRNGEAYEVEADILLACDGLKSAVRVAMLKELKVDATIKDTNQSAYRIILKREDMKNDPELLELIDSDSVTRWIGEKRHIIAYSVDNKNIYNLSTAQPDLNFASAPSITYTTTGSKSEMMGTFHDFCPKVQKMLDLVPDGEVVEWKLRVHHPLPTWIYGSTALVGDACHPTLPHLNQGAAQAIEDAAVLSVVLARMPDSTATTINKTLRVYEKVRKNRAETLVDLAAESGRTLHLGEGKAKEERDKAFAAATAASGGAKLPDKWADADVQKMIFGHDCMKIAEDEFDSLYAAMPDEA